MGYVLYEGPSVIDGSNIVVLATGADRASSNAKTGPMLQVWIVQADVDPLTANQDGLDVGVCGGCPLKGVNGVGRVCYVLLWREVRAVWQAWRDGSYERVAFDELSLIGARRKVRLGAFGDPAAVPIPVWDGLLAQSRGWTGYTHQWRNPALRAVLKYCLASCETEADVERATGLGFGTYRVLGADAAPLSIETPCPSPSGVTCIECMQCDGTSSRHLTIPVHGAGAKWWHSDDEVGTLHHVNAKTFAKRVPRPLPVWGQ